MRATDSISPSFQGSFGSVSISSGAHQLALSGSQAAASVIMSGLHAIQNGFFSFLAVTVVAPGQSQTITTPAGPITVTIPASAVPEGTNITIQVPALVPQSTGSSLVSIVNTAIEILSPVQPATPVTLLITYAVSDLGGVDPNLLTIARYDPGQGLWVPLISSVNTVNGTVTASITHFSIFQIMVSRSAADLAAVRVIPNPFRPTTKGHVAVGLFNLPANARVRIYSFSGELVRDMAADARGLAVWDGKNQNGAKAGSGTYFGYAQAAGRSKTFKVSIQR